MVNTARDYGYEVDQKLRPISVFINEQKIILFIEMLKKCIVELLPHMRLCVQE